ncbi:MAG: hypothetical protein FWB78_12585 [Treponema sp.]|nr:hypothetical protein [Treponema sp.]
MSEDRYIKQNHGKWSQKGVPHKGWECIDIEDSGEQATICEMCESQSIRYIHYMRHPDYADTLGVGCVCAGNMEENLHNAKSRDDFMKSRASKRKRWIDHRSWKVSMKGNDWIKTDGYVITMVDHNVYWSASIKEEGEENGVWLPRKFDLLESAKLAAFDYVTKLLAEN